MTHIQIVFIQREPFFKNIIRIGRMFCSLVFKFNQLSCSSMDKLYGISELIKGWIINVMLCFDYRIDLNW